MDSEKDWNKPATAEDLEVVKDLAIRIREMRSKIAKELEESRWWMEQKRLVDSAKQIPEQSLAEQRPMIYEIYRMAGTTPVGSKESLDQRKEGLCRRLHQCQIQEFQLSHLRRNYGLD